MERSKSVRCWLIAATLASCIGAHGRGIPPQASPATGPLRVHPTNPRFFADAAGRAVYLTGSHTWGNLADAGGWPAFDYDGYLDFLQSYNHNFIRLWSGYNLGRAPIPYVRSGPGAATDGDPRVDLSRFDQAFFDRLRSRTIAARDRGIYVGIMLFAPDGAKKEDWPILFFHPSNNIQGIDADTNGDGSGAESFDLSLPAVTAYQEAFVRKVIDTVNDLDNVLYEIGNEGDLTSIPWQYHMIDVIRAHQAGKPRQHPVGMTAVFNILSGSWAPDNAALFNSGADWISPGIDPYRDNPPAADGRKVIIADVDHIWPTAPHRGWIWECFLRGIHPILMDWYSYGDPSWTSPAEQDAMRRSMGYTLAYARRMNLGAMTPQDGLSSTGYCLAAAGSEYLVYQPASGAPFTVDLVAGAYLYEWFDPGTGTVSGSGSLAAPAGNTTFSASFSGESVLYLKATAPTANQPPSVAITRPADGASYTAPADILIEAAALDPDGGVLRVEFFQGSAKLGEDLSAPYAWTWSGVPSGSYTLTARATDNAGATATSAPVRVTVVDPSSQPQSVTGFTLVDADTDADIGPLADGDTLNLALLPTRNLNLRADTSPAAVGSVRFGLDGNPAYRTENVVPYALAGDAAGDYGPWTPGLGSHFLSATPYSQADGAGTAGTPLVIAFTVIDDPGAPPPGPAPGPAPWGDGDNPNGNRALNDSLCGALGLEAALLWLAFLGWRRARRMA
jgi:hypothetical protein